MKTNLLSLLTLPLIGVSTYKLLTTNIEPPTTKFYYPVGTVMIKSKDKVCSGVAIKNDTVMTAKHCLDEKLTVTTLNGKELEATVKDESKDMDLAVLTVKEPILIPVVMAEDLPSKASKVYAIGHPQAKLIHAEGQLLAVNNGRIESKIAIEPGFSGGGVYNDQMQLVGITSSKTDNGLSYSVLVVD